MTTWTTITIRGAEALTKKKIIKGLHRAGIEMDTSPWGRAEVREFHGEWEFTTESKWELDGRSAFAEDMSRRHENATVVVQQTWDDDDGGQKLEVFQAGKLLDDLTRISDLVPADLSTRISAVQRALEGDGDLPKAAAHLVDGLLGDPRTSAV